MTYLIVFILVDHRGNDVNLSVVQYYLTEKEHPVYKPPFGNSNSTTYERFLPRTFDRKSWLVRMVQWLHLNR